ncbi:MAG: hypothetical protein FH751_17300 [Firmicutes bacterium]|nr:hypothetical protein [Bacillota bacterium]
MLLDYELAQRFVDRIIDNFDKNINIMNESGVIIASGSKERIGTYHKVAEDVIRKNKRIDISKKDASKYEGVKEGVNMPFYYNDSVGGVVGITGEPKKIEKTVKIIKMVLEVMIEQELLKERVYTRQSQKTFFINNLLDMETEDDLISSTQWAKKLGFNINLKRIVMIMKITNLEKVFKKSPLYTEEKIKEFILNEISKCDKSDSEDIYSNITNDKIIVFKTVKSKREESIYKEVYNFSLDISERLKDLLGLKLLIGIGTFHDTPLKLKESFKESKAMLKMGNRLDLKEGTLLCKDHIFEYLFSKIDESYLEHFLYKYYKKIKDEKELIETIEELLKCNMNIKKTSENLYIHRNTAVFRYKKIKNLLKIDPINNDEDRILLRLLVLYLKYNKNI